jgi:3-hydroxyacyl-[acyl-carrier-protein] dehydratase
VSPTEKKKPVLDWAGIADLLPHRAPLLLVDRVLELNLEDLHIEATKCVSSLDPVFEGHFPGNPVVPGVYMIEGLAQTSALLCFVYFRNQAIPFEPRCLLTSVDEARFRKTISPGDVMHYHVKFERSRGSFAWFSGQVKVDGELVAEAKFSALLPANIPSRKAVQP